MEYAVYCDYCEQPYKKITNYSSTWIIFYTEDT